MLCWIDDEFFTSKEAACDYLSRFYKEGPLPNVYQDQLLPMTKVIEEGSLRKLAEEIISLTPDFIPEVCGEDGDYLDTGESIKSLTNHLAMWLDSLGGIHCPSNEIVDTSDWEIEYD